MLLVNVKANIYLSDNNNTFIESGDEKCSLMYYNTKYAFSRQFNDERKTVQYIRLVCIYIFDYNTITITAATYTIKCITGILCIVLNSITVLWNRFIYFY